MEKLPSKRLENIPFSIGEHLAGIHFSFCPSASTSPATFSRFSPSASTSPATFSRFSPLASTSPATFSRFVHRRAPRRQPFLVLVRRRTIRRQPSLVLSIGELFAGNLGARSHRRNGRGGACVPARTSAQRRFHP